MKTEGARDASPKVEKVFDLPEPEVRARPAEPSEIPASAKRLAKLAEANGWEVRTTYARGPYMNADTSLNRIVDSIRVSGRRGGQAFSATWVSDAHGKMPFESGHIKEKNGLASSPELNAYIKGGTK